MGEVLLAALEARGWTQVDFAEILSRPPQLVSGIVSGRKEITRETAAQVAAALDTTAQFWLDLQNRHHLHRQGRDQRLRTQLADIRLRSRLAELAPMAALRKRGVITAPTAREQAAQLCRLLEIENPDRHPSSWATPCPPGPATPARTAWLACVRRRARGLPAATYLPQRLRALAGDLTGTLPDLAAVADLPRRFADAGVRLVHVEAFPPDRSDGVSFLLDDCPVIGLSGREPRFDKVVLALLHQVAHILFDHPPCPSTCGGDVDSESESDAERRAREWALPTPPPVPAGRVDRGRLAAAARSLGVHPSIVVGHLQQIGRLNQRSLLAEGIPSVADALRSW